MTERRGMLARIVDKLRGRRFDGAGGGRRWQGAQTLDNLNSAILAGAGTLRRRGRYYTANNAWASHAADEWVSSLVGTGIVPQSQHPDPATRKLINALFLRWTDHSDADGVSDFFGQQAVIARGLVEAGEGFARFEIDQQRRAGIVPLKVRLVDAEQVDPALSRELGGGARIVGGIEFDTNGNRAAFHVFRTRPGDPFGAMTPLDQVRVPANDMVQIFKPLQAGQVRGVSWLAPILLRLHEIDAYQDAQLVKQKVAALLAGFIYDAEGGTAGFDGDKPGDGTMNVSLEPGEMRALPSGKRVEFSDPPQVAETVEYLKLELRAVAAGLGLTYEALTGDLSGVNYSSIRAGLVAFRRRVEMIQHQVLVHQFCRPTWERFIRLAVLAGELPASAFAANPHDFLVAKWVTPGFDWVDPLKDTQAEVLAINNRLKSRRQVVAGRGEDIEQLDAEITAEGGPPVAAQPAKPQPQQTEDTDADA